jgi:methyl-accepting chemotaxis protein
LLIAFVLAGPASSVLMAAIGYVKGIDILTNPAQGYFHMQAMVGFMALALGGTLLVALVFKQILTSDLLDTIVRVSDALDRLAGGERSVQVPVYSTDELGRLAERTNALSDALARAAGHADESAELNRAPRPRADRDPSVPIGTSLAPPRP